MSSATARRFALVAAIVLLLPVWWAAGPSAGARDRPRAELVRPAAPAATPDVAVRRLAGVS
ncbi:MAG: hypothetical protein M3326_14025, partial [Actinomycetota bacterium]|nr:hypothetical protein [Actinomycetota bacterium]